MGDEWEGTGEGWTYAVRPAVLRVEQRTSWGLERRGTSLNETKA